MNIKTKKALAGGALVISLGALALGVSGVGPALATSEGPLPSGGGDTDLTASTLTGAWCGWYLTDVSSELVLEPVNALETTYVGTAIDLTATDLLGSSAFVGGTDVHDDDTTNCSWYGAPNQQAVEVSIEADSANFEAMAEFYNDETDTSMDFSLNSDNPLTITVDEDLATDEVTGLRLYCNGFDVTEVTTIYGTLLDLISNPISSAVYTDVGTTDRCDWDVTYSTSIPAGLVPTYGGTTYSYTGPTLTTTLEIIETAPAP